MATVNTQNVALSLKNHVQNDSDLKGLDLEFTVEVNAKNELVVSSSDFAAQSFPRMYMEMSFSNFGSSYNKERNVWVVCLKYKLKQSKYKGDNWADYVSFEFNSDGEVLDHVDRRNLHN